MCMNVYYIYNILCTYFINMLYVNVVMYVCMYFLPFTYACLYVCINVRMNVCMNVCINVRMCTCTLHAQVLCIWSTCMYLHVCMYMFMYVCTCSCMYVCMTPIMDGVFLVFRVFRFCSCCTCSCYFCFWHVHLPWIDRPSRRITWPLLGHRWFPMLWENCLSRNPPWPDLSWTLNS